MEVDAGPEAKSLCSTNTPPVMDDSSTMPVSWDSIISQEPSSNEAGLDIDLSDLNLSPLLTESEYEFVLEDLAREPQSMREIMRELCDSLPFSSSLSETDAIAPYENTIRDNNSLTVDGREHKTSGVCTLEQKVKIESKEAQHRKSNLNNKSMPCYRKKMSLIRKSLRESEKAVKLKKKSQRSNTKVQKRTYKYNVIKDKPNKRKEMTMKEVKMKNNPNKISKTLPQEGCVTKCMTTKRSQETREMKSILKHRHTRNQEPMMTLSSLQTRMFLIRKQLMTIQDRVRSSLYYQGEPLTITEAQYLRQQVYSLLTELHASQSASDSKSMENRQVAKKILSMLEESINMSNATHEHHLLELDGTSTEQNRQNKELRCKENDTNTQNLSLKVLIISKGDESQNETSNKQTILKMKSNVANLKNNSNMVAANVPKMVENPNGYGNLSANQSVKLFNGNCIARQPCGITDSEIETHCHATANDDISTHKCQVLPVNKIPARQDSDVANSKTLFQHCLEVTNHEISTQNSLHDASGSVPLRYYLATSAVCPNNVNCFQKCLRGHTNDMPIGRFRTMPTNMLMAVQQRDIAIHDTFAQQSHATVENSAPHYLKIDDNSGQLYLRTAQTSSQHSTRIAAQECQLLLDNQTSMQQSHRITSDKTSYQRLQVAYKPLLSQVRMLSSNSKEIVNSCSFYCVERKRSKTDDTNLMELVTDNQRGDLFYTANGATTQEKQDFHMNMDIDHQNGSTYVCIEQRVQQKPKDSDCVMVVCQRDEMAHTSSRGCVRKISKCSCTTVRDKPYKPVYKMYGGTNVSAKAKGFQEVIKNKQKSCDVPASSSKTADVILQDHSDTRRIGKENLPVYIFKTAKVLNESGSSNNQREDKFKHVSSEDSDVSIISISSSENDEEDDSEPEFINISDD